MNEAIEEHHVVHGVIGELKKMKPADERYDAKVTVLGELCKHHIKEEEEEMLPKAEKRDIDWDRLVRAGHETERSSHGEGGVVFQQRLTHEFEGEEEEIGNATHGCD